MKFRLLSVLLIISTLVANAFGQQKDYPAPRYPKLPDSITDEQLLQVASTLVKEPVNRGGYGIQAGEKVLVLASTLYDPRVYQSLVRAIREAGAQADLFLGELPYSEEGSEQLKIFLNMYVNEQALERSSFGGFSSEEVEQLAKLGKYNVVIGGYTGGPKIENGRLIPVPSFSADSFFRSTTRFPRELRELLEKKAWQQFRQARKVRVTDPEGTDLRWEMPPEIEKVEAPVRYWNEWLCMPEHLVGAPDTFWGAKINGVIAGTMNHVGPFPHMKIFVKDDKVERIEGGGKFGEGLKEIIAKYETTTWPNLPGPSFRWMQECAIGLDPTAARPREWVALPTMEERRRSGIFHWAFGVENFETQSKKAQQILLEKKLPDGHFDVHNKFPTMILETAQGEEIVFLDKGRMTALDDPEVRALAARFGNPDELLQEAWIPAIPGINVSGDYMKEYASDPLTWMKNEYQRFARPQK
ncbi:MAG: hypothetical protein HY645_07750 [Acidobacteria bacterium]|nr:hypothetical protein [Acidobacteriota bacterium]